MRVYVRPISDLALADLVERVDLGLCVVQPVDCEFLPQAVARFALQYLLVPTVKFRVLAEILGCLLAGQSRLLFLQLRLLVHLEAL